MVCPHQTRSPSLRGARRVSAREGRKPLITNGAAWVLFVTTVVPIPLLIGAILLLESSAVSRVVGAMFVAVGVIALIAMTVMAIRRKPHEKG